MVAFIVTFLWVLLFVVAVVAVYASFCFTYVKEGTSKQVVRFGAFRESLLAKKGFKFDSEWNVVKLVGNDKPKYPEFLGGLRWVSWLKPLGIDKIYVSTIKFVKALTGGTFEKREDKDTNFFLTGTQYIYSLIFSNMEDSEKVPLSGQMTMTVVIENPYKALFLVKNWFDALSGRILPRVREYISNHSYDDIIYKPEVKLDEDVFELLDVPDKADSLGRSIKKILLGDYGIKLVALETVNIDPPEGYRETTLRKYTAKQNADAESEETGGALDKIIDKRIKGLADRLGMDADQIKQYLKDNPDVLRRIEDIGLDLLRRDRAGKAGPGLRDIRVGNADGSNLDPITATIASLISLIKGGGGDSGAGKNQKKQKPQDMSDEESLDIALSD